MEYLTREHSEKQLRRWAKTLKYFRFHRATSGMSYDPDHFELAISYTSTDELERTLTELGATIVRQDPDPAKRGPMTPSTPTPIAGADGIVQPKPVEINGVRVFLFCGATQISVTVIGSKDKGFTVVEEDATRTAAVDPFFAKYADRLVDPPKDWKNYVCPKYYPEWFDEDGTA